MKIFMRGVVVMLMAASILPAGVAAQDKSILTSDREKTSYAVGMDVGSSIRPVGPDLDLAAFERAVRHAFTGGKPTLSKDEAAATDRALRARIGSREGKPVAGAEPGAPMADVSKDKVGQLLGGYMVGPSLLPIKDELEVPLFMQAVRTMLAGDKPLLDDAQVKQVLTAFSQRIQGERQVQAAAASGKNKLASQAYLARNKMAKGVVVTPSGLQYMVLRQGAGPRPKASDKVRVNYHGTLLDGTVFDSSYDRGQAAEFGLDQVIPGWTEGLALMAVGAKYRFWIPSELAYGDKGTPDGSIGPNAALIFDVELMDIQ